MAPFFRVSYRTGSATRFGGARADACGNAAMPKYIGKKRPKTRWRSGAKGSTSAISGVCEQLPGHAAMYEGGEHSLLVGALLEHMVMDLYGMASGAATHGWSHTARRSAAAGGYIERRGLTHNGRSCVRCPHSWRRATERCRHGATRIRVYGPSGTGVHYADTRNHDSDP